MKIFSKLLLIMAMLVSLTPTYVFADKTPAPTRVITLKKKPPKDYGTQLPPNKHRTPSQPIECVISSNVVSISADISTSDILSYEIWDTAGEVCLASFIDESDLIEYVFANDQEMQIQFVTESYVLAGFL